MAARAGMGRLRQKGDGMLIIVILALGAAEYFRRRAVHAEYIARLTRAVRR